MQAEMFCILGMRTPGFLRDLPIISSTSLKTKTRQDALGQNSIPANRFLLFNSCFTRFKGLLFRGGGQTLLIEKALFD